MAKKLKLGFAMGGGVSLGTFSGSALTETIKQYMVYGKDEEGNPYEEVIIDVFSGASAGAMSLLVMLRGLFYYEDKLLQLTSLKRFNGLKTKEEVKQKITEHLVDQFEEAFHQLDEKNKEKLIAVQATQELQRLTWVKEANIENIARLDNDELMLSKGSILDRDFLVYDMAGKAIYFDDDETAASTNIKPVGPLADRVLYACTLTRIEPRLIKGEKFHKILDSDTDEERERKKDLNELYDKILTDGASSKTHKDLRIFDLCFDELELSQVNDIEKYPSRWINVHAGESIKNSNKFGKNLWSFRSSKCTDDFNQGRTWIEMACTAMAAGSFPIAFEPVVLKRYYSELTQSEKITLKNRDGAFLRFSYLDGGTFNNEPISEAFKLAGFIDNQDLEGIQGKEFDRRIIFVDPNIGEASTINNYDYLREFKLNPYKKKPTKRTGLNKITQLIPPIMSLLRNEGSVVELDKAKEIINKFELSDNLKKNYVATIRNGFPPTFDKKSLDKKKAKELDEEIVKMRGEVQSYLEQAADKSMIPKTYRNLNLAIRKHIVNDINSKTNYFPNIKNYQLNKLKEISGYEAFFEGNKPFSSQPSQFQDWLILLYFTLLELSQDLVEKNKLSKIIPIGPVKIHDTGEIESVELKGSAIAAFYGFFSEGIRTHDFNEGIYAAIEIFNYLNNNNIGKSKQQTTTLKGLLPEAIDEGDVVNEKLYTIVKKRIFDEFLNHNLIEITSDSSVREKFSKSVFKPVMNWGKNIYLKSGFEFAKSRTKKLIIDEDFTKKYKKILLEFRIRIDIDKELKELKEYIITDDENSRWISGIKPVYIKEDSDQKGFYYFIVILKYKFEEKHTESTGKWINWEGEEISFLKIAENKKLMQKGKITHWITLPKHNFVIETLEKGLYNYFKLNLSDIEQGEKNPWRESREEASSLAGLIYGKKQQKQNKTT